MISKDNFRVPFVPMPIKIEELGRGRIFTLRGPRQVGKTRFLRYLHEKTTELRSIYESLDIVRTEKELVAFVRRCIRDHNPKLILLDEISSVSRWQKAMKYLADKDEIGGIDFILSGSSATDIKRGAERLPGRRGPEVAGGWDRILLPLSFSQFVKHTATLTSEEIEMARSCAQDPSLLSGEIHRKMLDAFTIFVRVGGLPPSVLAWQSGEEMPYRTMMAIIRSDFEKRKKSRIILDQVLARLDQVAATAVTWEVFAQPVTATKVITRQYVDELCENYLLLDIECIDLARDRRAPRKPRKLYWIDPLIPNAIEKDGIGNGIDEPAIVESLVAFELARRHETNLWEGLNQLRRLYIWRDSRGNEVDFVLWNDQKTAIEVKWQNNVSEWDAKVLSKTFGGGFLLCKNQFAEFGNVKVMPAYWFLFLLNP